MKRITRIWQGRKECAVRDYFVGQVFDANRQFWIDVTREYATHDQAAQALQTDKRPGIHEEESE